MRQSYNYWLCSQSVRNNRFEVVARKRTHILRGEAELSSRSFKNFWSDIKRALNDDSGWMALSAIGLGAVGAVTSAPIALGSGAIAVICFGTKALCKAWPEIRPNPGDFLITPIENINALDEFDPPPEKIGLCGATGSGKTMLLWSVARKPFTDEELISTTETTALILHTNKGHNSFAAFLDGRGQELVQQLNILANSDDVVLLLDHNISENSKQLDNSRLIKHQEFLEQLFPGLKKNQKLKRIHLVLNKSDLWKHSSEEEYLREWLYERKKSVENYMKNRDVKVTSSVHSNLSAKSISQLCHEILD